jgi:hypothetical protein
LASELAENGLDPLSVAHQKAAGLADVAKLYESFDSHQMSRALSLVPMAARAIRKGKRHSSLKH